MADEIYLDLGELEEAFRRLKRKARNFRDAFRAFRPELNQDIRAHFENRTGPSATWAPRAPSSIERMLAGGGRVRRGKRKGQVKKRAQRRLDNQLGRLKYALQFTVTGSYIEVRSRVPWGTIHQTGGTAGKGARIPARPFLWASAAKVELLRRMVVKELKAAIRGRR